MKKKRGRPPAPYDPAHPKWRAVAWLEENPGGTHREAADLFGISRQSVQIVWAKKHGTPPREKLRQEVRARAVAHAHDGLHAVAIAKCVGASWSSVMRWCRDAGVEIAPFPRKATPEALSMAIGAISAGESIAVAAMTAGLTYSYFQKIMYTYGFRSRARGGTMNGIAAAAASKIMDREGVSMEIAATQVGCSPNSLRAWRIRRGLPLRKR